MDLYTLNQRETLYRYLDDGWLKPDNNTAENAIRPLALGRKNWLFYPGPQSGPHQLTLGVTFPNVNLSYHPFGRIKDGLVGRLYWVLLEHF